MSVQHANRGIVKKDLQLYYNREFSKCFRGESTTNIVSNTTDFSGVSYAGYETEWSSDPTRFTKTYNSNLQTPIGTGATLLTESGTAGYHHLSRLGGSGTGNHSISCYVYAVNGNITNFAIGMLGDSGSTAIFNLVTGVVVSTGARVTNAFITKVSAWSGWYRVGANIGGRSGGWVGALGLDVQTSYTPSLPYKSMYVTGLQYESKAYCTPFVVSSNRSANTVAGGGGLLDMSGNNVNADLTNVLFNSSGYYFDGSSTSINTGYSILNIDPSQSFSIEAIVNFDALTSYSPSTFTISNVNTTTNVITTSVTHNLVTGDRISFNVSGGSLPSPLLDGSNIAPYYIISPTTNTFKVSTSSGGSEVDITTAGSGTITALVPSKAGMLFGRANYGGIGIYYYISATNVVTIFGYLRTTAGYYNTAGAVISTGVTYLITVVFDELNGRIYSLYLNGVFQGSAYCPSSATYNNGAVGNFSIGEGGQADGGGTLIYNPFKGSCPMQRIYRRALTAEEVLQNFNATRKTYGI